MSTPKIPDAVLDCEGLAVRYTRGTTIPSSLILAIIWQESSGDQWAVRWEKAYQYFCRLNGKPLYRKNLNYMQNRGAAVVVLGEWEFYMQSASHGLLQLMGAVARELGWRKSLMEIYDPNINISLGVKHLQRKIKQAGSLRGGIVRYNGAGAVAEQYATSVLRKEQLIKAQL